MCEAPGCTNVGRDFDHIKPVAFGGASTLENCQLLCRDCNAEKGIQEGRDAAKADRKGGRSGQHARRTRAKAEGRYRPIPSPKVSGLSKHSAGYRKPEWRKEEEMTTDTKKLRELLAESEDDMGEPLVLRVFSPGDDSGDCWIECKYKDEWEPLWGSKYMASPEAIYVGNAALIAAAVNALPALLDEVEGLREERDRMREALEEVVGCFDAASTEGLATQLWLGGERTEPGDLRDLVMRRLLPAAEAARAALGETK
jgi:hypothetical protein